MMDRCSRCGWDSPAGSEFCRRCGQSLINATRLPAPPALPQTIQTALAMVPPQVWRGAAAVAVGAAFELARRIVTQRINRPAVTFELGERALAPDSETLRQVARDPNVEVSELIIYRRITRRR